MLILYIIIIFTFISSISGLFMYLVCLIFNIQVSEVVIFFGTLKKFSIGATKFKIGWLPLGASLQAKGYSDDDESPIDEYDLRSKNLIVKLLLDSAAFVSTLAIAFLYYYFVIQSFGNISLLDIYQRFTEISIDNFTWTHEQLVIVFFVFAAICSFSNLILFFPQLFKRLKINISIKESIKTTIYSLFMISFLCFYIYMIYEVLS